MANGVAILGTDPNLESSIPVYDTQNGLYWKEVWAGSETGINQKLALLNLDSDQRFDIDPSESPLFRLTVITPDYNDGRSNALNKFELLHNKVEKEIYEHRKAKAIGVDAVRAIKKYIKDKTELDASTAYFSSDDEARLYGLALKGSSKTLTHEWVFRYSITTSKRFATLVSMAGTEKLWTTAQLLTPSTSGLIIPANTLFALASIPAPGGVTSVTETFTRYDGTPAHTVSHTYKWMWLKIPPEFEQLPSGKMVIRQEWWLDMWSNWEYEEV